MFLVFKNPFIYAVAGYGVFSWVKGGVMSRRSFKRNIFAKVIFIYWKLKFEYFYKKNKLCQLTVLAIKNQDIFLN